MTKAAASVEIHTTAKTSSNKDIRLAGTGCDPNAHTQMTPFIRFLNLCRHCDITVSYADSFPPSVNEKGWNHCLQVYY